MALITTYTVTTSKSLYLARFFPKTHTPVSIRLVGISSSVSHRPLRLHVSRSERISYASSDLLQSYSSLHVFFSQRTVAKYIEVSQGRNLIVTLTPSLLVPQTQPIFKAFQFHLLNVSRIYSHPQHQHSRPCSLTPDLLHWLPNSYSPSSNWLFMLQPNWFSQSQISYHHVP